MGGAAVIRTGSAFMFPVALLSNLRVLCVTSLAVSFGSPKCMNFVCIWLTDGAGLDPLMFRVHWHQNARQFPRKV